MFLRTCTLLERKIIFLQNVAGLEFSIVLLNVAIHVLVYSRNPCVVSDIQGMVGDSERK